MYFRSRIVECGFGTCDKRFYYFSQKVALWRILAKFHTNCLSTLRRENISCSAEKWRLSSLTWVWTHIFSYASHYHMIQTQGNKSFRKQIIKFWFVGSIFIVFFYNSKESFSWNTNLKFKIWFVLGGGWCSQKMYKMEIW